MKSREKIEGYLINLGITFEEIGPASWLINDDEKGLERVIVIVEDPLVMFRVKVMDLPAKRTAEFMEKLLRLNASDLVHGAYALDEDGSVLLVDTLQATTLDIEEFQASLDAIGLALAQHYPILSAYRE
jgi:hypothetical protein